MKVLVTGASGFLGTVLCKKLLAHGFQLVKISHKDCDITNYYKLKKIFSKERPNLVIHAAALTDVDYCEENKEECFRINVIGTEFVQSLCNEFNIKMVLISTDFVFDGVKGDYGEEDFRNPINYYGFSKMIAEDISRKLRNYLIIRTSSMFGYFHNKKTDFPSFVIKNLIAGKEVKIAKDFFRKPVFVDDLADTIIFLIKNNNKGIFHACGMEKISTYEFALMIAKKFNLNQKLIKPVFSQEIDFKAMRPKDSSLNTKKIENLGYKFLSLEEAIKKSDYKRILRI